MSDHHKAPNKSQMDMHQIFKHSFDDKTGSLRTIPGTNTNFEISLNAEQDSITSVRRNMTIIEAGEYSCVGINTVCGYGQVKLELSPSDQGDEWYVLSDNSSGVSQVFTICARRIRTSGAGKVVGQG